jgi:hypothetical protein
MLNCSAYRNHLPQELFVLPVVVQLQIPHLADSKNASIQKILTQAINTTEK